jgi:tripartite-type tricarboxylate transporter receptor subunit TctC
MAVVARRRLAIAAAAASLVAIAPWRAHCAEDRILRLLVPFPASGAASDIVARIIARPLSASLGREVVVENMPGGAGSVAAGIVAKARPDGKTLLLASPGPNTLGPALNQVPYDPLTAFSPVSMVAETPMILVTSISSQCDTIADLIALGERTIDPIKFGSSSGAGGMPHLAMELFQHRTGLRAAHVPYPGANESLMDVMAGRIATMFCALGSALGYVEGKQLKVLGVASRGRLREVPHAPTMEESGVPNFDITNWFGLVGPAGLDPVTVLQLAEVIQQLVLRPELSRQLENAGFVPRATGPDALAAHIRAEHAAWKDLVRARPSLLQLSNRTR